MKKCAFCREEFDVSRARRIIGRKYGAGTYDDYYPEGDICEDCAIEEISCDFAAGEEIKSLRGGTWD